MTQKNIIFSILAILLIGLQPITAQQKQVIDQVAAVVGKHVILQSDIENQYIQYRLQRGISGSAESIRCQILEDLLFQKLMLNQAEIDSITVTDEQINQEMERRLRYFIDELGSQEKLEAYYNKSINDIKNELRRLVKDQMLVQEVQNNIMMNVEVTPSEIRSFYRSIPTDSIPMINTEYEIAQIVKNPPISIDEKLQVKERLYTLRKRILDGERFSTLAVLYSEDPGSARKGGELGYYGRGELYPEFEAVAFSLKDGEISEIVETEAGFHIIQMIGRRGEYVNVRHILLMAKVSLESLEKAKNELDTIAALIRNDSITFEQAVEKYSQAPNKSKGGLLLNPYTGSTLFEADDLDPQVSFVIDKLKVGEISDPVPMKTEDGKDAYRIVMLKKKTTPHQANLKDDYNRLQMMALQQKKQASIEKWIRNKSNSAYVRISENFGDCNFTNNWMNE
ncbi:MAG: peptidylprolyl isomerase [Bacteroidetes bacterium]|nr:peptidylprolyl isomerase [Bacteroidota bacterium]MBU1579414.1 peptidylprolyl isomerase [Bacteroidota bacterium]MBU2559092.1 peptidylprolyl isomerase [Bacteroidota bacterium]